MITALKAQDIVSSSPWPSTSTLHRGLKLESAPGLHLQPVISHRPERTKVYLRVLEQLDGGKVLVRVTPLAPVLLLDLRHHPLQLGHLLPLAGGRALHSAMETLGTCSMSKQWRSAACGSCTTTISTLHLQDSYVLVYGMKAEKTCSACCVWQVSSGSFDMLGQPLLIGMMLRYAVLEIGKRPAFLDAL